MLRHFSFVCFLVPALAATALAQKGGSGTDTVPCHPCMAVGSCTPVDPIESGADHACQKHAKHEHRRMMIAGSDFTKASFASADLRGSRFYGSVFEYASLYSADISYGGLVACDADRIVMSEVTAKGADFSMSSLRYGFFLRADFEGAVLVADFSSANLREADLSGAVLSDGLEMADFRNADLSFAVGLYDTVGLALYSPCTDFTGTGFDPELAGWVLSAGAEIGERYCSPAKPNSTGNSGLLTVSGCQEVELNSLELRASCLPMGQFGVFLASQSEGFTANPNESSGDQCLGGRICAWSADIQDTGMDGEMLLSVDLDALPPPLHGAVTAGDTWYYQAWFRDVEFPRINPLRTSNFTDAVAVTFH